MIRAVLAALALAGAADATVELTFTDPEIIESSGLVALGDRLVTVNDSGDEARVFTVDPDGTTIGVTTWDAEAEDIEALAPAGSDAVWVGDIGDNRTRRDSITVWEVPLPEGGGEVEATAFELTYPDGAHDAESLLAHPVTGRLYVATKDVFGGSLFAAPAELRVGVRNEMAEVGPVMAIATDGAFLPDGDALVLRGYRDAVLYEFPSLEPVTRFPLPDQRQGEGLAVTAAGDLLLSTEGLNSEVLRIALPAPSSSQSTSPPSSPSTSPSPSASPTETVSREGRDLPETTETVRPPFPWFIGGFIGLGIIMVLAFSLRPR